MRPVFSGHRVFALLVATTIVATAHTSPEARQSTVIGSLALTSERAPELRTLAGQLDTMQRSGRLRASPSTGDDIALGFRHDRLQQYHLGLPVVGGDLTRQFSGDAVTAIFGNLFDIERSDTIAKRSPDDVRRQLLAEAGAELLRMPELKWLGEADGHAVLVYEAIVLNGPSSRMVFIDADSGVERQSVSLVHTQSAVGEGAGVLGDRKKISTSGSTGSFVLTDLQRPPILQTLDLKGNTTRYAQLRAQSPVGQSDIASDSDNVWTDSAAVDGHVYLGWTYDYLFKRFGFRGLNNGNAPMFGLVNLYSAANCVSLPASFYYSYCVNASWTDPPLGPGGNGMMFFGNGLALTVYDPDLGQTIRPLSGAIDIVAHELTHGVTNFTSDLVYRNESGALNESFSDMMGTAVEAFYQPKGTQYQGADYLLGEDVFRAAVAGARDGSRSLANPSNYGDPDHYSLRQYIGSLTSDSGGVHSNSGISNHAYYLSIEGGVNRVSGRSVTGVGFNNREQIEKIFFRAFTMLLPSNSTFYQARLATIQSARDLYGTGSLPERAVTQAWDAVGVTSPGAALRTAFTPNPVPASNVACGGVRPGFFMTVSVTEFQGVAYNVAGFDAVSYDSAGRLISSESFSPSTFAQWFTDCGTGSTQIRAGATACARLCTDLGGRSAGVTLWRFRGADVNGNTGTFISDPFGLGMAVGDGPDDPTATYSPVTIRKVQ